MNLSQNHHSESQVTRADGRSVVRDAREIRIGERLHARLSRGTLDLDVVDAGEDGDAPYPGGASQPGTQRR